MDASSASPDAAGAAIDLCITQLASRFDARRGGFGNAPKFPRPAELNVFLHQYLRLVAGGEGEAAREYSSAPHCCWRSFVICRLVGCNLLALGSREQWLGGCH